MVRTGTQIKSRQAYDKIRTLICGGGFSPGERLTEMKVAERVGMSRGVVRESLLRLEAEGVLKLRGTRRGRFVEYFEDHKLEDILNQYELREVIEGQAARLAAKNMNGWQIDELRQIAEQIRAGLQTNDRDIRLEASRRFHSYLMLNCGNTLLLKVWEEYNLMPLTTRNPITEEKILAHLSNRDTHEEKIIAVVEAIAEHNPDRAEQCMREFIREITEAIRQAIRNG